MSSKMPNVYIHYFGNESSKSLLQAYGIEDYSNKQASVLKSRTCPNCNESNRQDSKFCIKCRMVLNYDAYAETLEEQKRKEDQIKRLEEKYETGMKKMKEDIENKLQQIMAKIDIFKV
jgi:hypothetical protein